MRPGLRHVAYLLALVCSSVGTAWLVSRCLPLLPVGWLGIAILLAAAALVCTGMSAIESKLLWQDRLQPRTLTHGAHSPRSTRLQGFAPLPVTLGVAVSALLALKFR